jgi:formylmethanofuran dehydrogenase subunit E
MNNAKVRERLRWARAPRCECCGEPELPEFLVNVEGFLVCRECMAEFAERASESARLTWLNQFALA